MPIIIPKGIPAYKVLTEENIFVMHKARAQSQDIRPIEIAIVNLMPTKIETETQLMRLLGNSPLQINVTLINTATYVGTHTALSHLDRFYQSFDEVKAKGRHFDGMIITGAPVETMAFSEVKYWEELTSIMDYARERVTSTIYICWGAQAALNYFYGIDKKVLEKKAFGISRNRKCVDFEPLLKGMNDVINIPHSRHTGIDEKALAEKKDLVVLARGDFGVSIIKAKDRNEFFFLGHSEYDRDTLKKEYERDLAKGLPIEPPFNYFDENGEVNMSWSSTANLIYYNWLNYYVYQVTPYDIRGEK